eukprot:CAMPEP_0183433432 /NCGR_PEP_ID=MMETSP0370-20130417/61385_1 /TAXON_ID=268820 /ORGANISM="Peridinium aciculiferum, Strain PAER-2" /LENGTH=64 /DNA_ID=CAMNT_0025619763 /DNA_START=313 /DNA_END=503 /DNA_ORIENTATION=+
MSVGVRQLLHSSPAQAPNRCNLLLGYLHFAVVALGRDSLAAATAVGAAAAVAAAAAAASAAAAA